jgi:hypothetical protein
LVGVDLIVVDRLSVCSDTPILDACRKLVHFGVDPKTPLHCFRNGRLAVTVRSIGEGARLEINGNGIGFVVRRRRAMVAASPVRNSEKSEPNYPAQIKRP